MPIIPANKEVLARRVAQRVTQRAGVIRTSFLAVLVLTFVIVTNDYVIYLDLRRGLCEEGKTEEANNLFSKLREQRYLATSIVAYVDEILNGAEDPCHTVYPESGLFEEYPVLIHTGGDGIARRPYGTVAYAMTITRCPEWYEPGVDDTQDPGAHIFEATAIIKDEICNATKTILGISTNSKDDRRGQTL